MKNKALDCTALTIAIIGAINWGLIGFFSFDLVAFIGGGQDGIVARIIYILVAAAGLWCISLFFRDNEMLSTAKTNPEKQDL
mgnify:CR=1 FL=1